LAQPAPPCSGRRRTAPLCSAPFLSLLPSSEQGSRKGCSRRFFSFLFSMTACPQ
jgi:hypothetical protein